MDHHRACTGGGRDHAVIGYLAKALSAGHRASFPRSPAPGNPAESPGLCHDQPQQQLGSVAHQAGPICRASSEARQFWQSLWQSLVEPGTDVAHQSTDHTGRRQVRRQARPALVGAASAGSMATGDSGCSRGSAADWPGPGQTADVYEDHARVPSSCGALGGVTRWLGAGVKWRGKS